MAAYKPMQPQFKFHYPRMNRNDVHLLFYFTQRCLQAKGLDRALDSAEHLLRTESDNTLFQAA